MTAAGYRQISLGHENRILVVPCLPRILGPANQLGRHRNRGAAPVLLSWRTDLSRRWRQWKWIPVRREPEPGSGLWPGSVKPGLPRGQSLIPPRLRAGVEAGPEGPQEPRILAAGMSPGAARAAGLSPFPGHVEPRSDKWRQEPQAVSVRQDRATRLLVTGSACGRQDTPRSASRRESPRLTVPCGRTLNAPRPERQPGFPGALSGSACLRPSWPGTRGRGASAPGGNASPVVAPHGRPGLVPGRGSSSARLCTC